MTSDRATFSAASGPAADHQQEGEMCGIMQGGLCRFSELTPGQFGLTKQLKELQLPVIEVLNQFVNAVKWIGYQKHFPQNN
ncbi:hypothetical protein ANCDUO_10395 [Ancylostoma duodenale]|uniref:Uncharacterized protein n=1 Tax=Ancylostoma duodenale TaxID=51022 RepID=A0A0C2GE09_9BILA|nr:hypothetical protein ANCDUO_10395 [Ancylostoma duodenale]